MPCGTRSEQVHLARRGCRGRRGTRGLLHREISTGVQQFRPATLCSGQCATSFQSSGSTVGHFLPRCHRALQGWKRRTPPRSRDPHVWRTWTVLILDFLRRGHWSMDTYLLWMVTCYFTPGEPLPIQRGDVQIPRQGISSRHQVLLYPEDGPLTSKTHAANDTVELYCPWCESFSDRERRIFFIEHQEIRDILELQADHAAQGEQAALSKLSGAEYHTRLLLEE